MFERLFQWTSRHGARVLFATALIIFVTQAVNGAVIYAESSPAEDMYGHAAPGHIAWRVILTVFASAFQSVVLPLTGALVLDRLKPRA